MSDDIANLQKALAEAQSKARSMGLKNLLKQSETWCELCGHIVTDDGCAYCLKNQLDAAQSKLHAFESAMEREKKPEWSQSLNELADRIELTVADDYYRADLQRAARELRSMADSFTLKTNFVPSELRIKELEKELADERKYAEDLAKDICKMEDVLGFKQDCHDATGAFVPTLGPWLERVRDLLAKEGELGDTQAHQLRIKELEAELALVTEACKGRVRQCDQLSSEADTLKSQLTQSEANQAVMREVLEYCDCEHDGPKDESGMCEFCKRVDNALATSSGKALLERLRRYRVALATIPTKETIGMAVKIARDALKEDGK